MSERTYKVIPQSKISEWQGLDRIAAYVHHMKCIWREQEKDDIGIDGEIELCKNRDDGDGYIGTGKIVKVQSKSGLSYIKRDKEKTFAASVRHQDLCYWRDVNLPVLFIVYHPEDDKLYWKDIKTYIDSESNIFTKPYEIKFNKQNDIFDENVYQQLCQLCEEAPERIDSNTDETLFSNLLEVTRLPEQIYVTSVLPEKRPQFHQRLSGFKPPYIFDDSSVISLTDPSITENALTPVIDSSSVMSVDLSDWLEQDEKAINYLKQLLNKLLHKHLCRQGLVFQRELKRYFYNEGLSKDKAISREWTNSRTGRTQPRLVGKYYVYGKHEFFKHLALSARFEQYGSKWAIHIKPMHYFSVDGSLRWMGETARSFSIRNRVREYNTQYLNHVLFWSFILSNGKPEFSLKLDHKPIVTIKGSPESVNVSFGIHSFSEKK
jgi:Domain of unknown function (DUF4365)